MRKTTCDICGIEYEHSFEDYYFGKIDVCNKCIKKIQDYINHLKKNQK